MTEPSTPLMRQYAAVKKEHPTALVFFRLGDFYELFFEDAVIAARELQITLTSRNKEKDQAIPMCGVPYHAAENYIARLIRAGHKVAICEQMEEPGAGKKIVRREVIRVLTPGTATGAGVIEATTSDEFFDCLQSLGAGRFAAGRCVAVLTISGGPGVLASDQADRLGLHLPPPSDATIRRVRELAPDFAAAGNPIDLTPQCPPANFPAAIQAVFDDPTYQGVVVINCGLDIAGFGEGVVAAQRRTGKPVTAFVLDVPGIEARLQEAGIPILPSPELAMAAYAALLSTR